MAISALAFGAGVARSLADARRRLCRVHGQCRTDALLRGLFGSVHRGVPMEPCRNLDRLFGLTARRRSELAAGRSVGRPARAAAPALARRQPARSRPVGQRVHFGTLADHPALRSGDDDRGQLPRTGRLCATAVAPFCAPAWHGDLDHAIGQRVWARCFGTARSIADLDPWLARDLSRAVYLHGRRGPVARLAVWPRGPITDPSGKRSDTWQFGSDLAAIAGMELGRSDPNAAFLAAFRGVPVHRPRELSGFAA